MDLWGVLNFWSLVKFICLNRISSYIGPMIPEEIINIMGFIEDVIEGVLVRRKINIFKRQEIDIPVRIKI